MTANPKYPRHETPESLEHLPSSFANFALDMPRLRYGGYNGGRQACLPFH